MKIAIIGRTEILYETCLLLLDNGYEISLIITHKEAPEYTKTAEDFRELAIKIGAKYFYTNKIREIKDDIRAIGELDLGVSMNYPTLIPQDVIELFRLGILNAHGGDLPRYRGNACQAWAILNGENKIGLCIHKMVGGELDSGDIIEREYLEINLNTKVTECWNWMKKRIPHMFLSAIKKLQENPDYILETQPKDPKLALRCYPLMPEDGRIDWKKSNIEILRLINAFNKPYSGAYCFYEGQKMIIWDAELYEDEEIYCAMPGQVAYLCADGSVIVITGKGKIKLKEIQIGDKIDKPRAWINTIRKRLQ